MLGYHVDRSNKLQEYQVVDSFNATGRLCENALSYAECVLNGRISRFGECYLNQMFYELPNGNFGANWENIIIERDFEFTRQRYYPDQVSRLQCAFAAPTIEDLEKSWGFLLDAGASIWQIEYESADYRDATFLKCYSLSTALQLSSKTPGFEGICKYWEGALSPEPQPELLVHLPFVALRKVLP